MSLDLETTRVLVSVPCGECGGNGTVYDPEGFGWAESVRLKGEDFRVWLANRGLSEKDTLPPEEGPCRECEGTGHQSREVALGEILSLARAPESPRTAA